MTANHAQLGRCHCGDIEFTVELEEGFKNLRRCNCSLCKRKGVIMASVPLNKLKVVRGEESLACYTWNTHQAKHYFCRRCGIYTHHQRRSKPDEYGFNVACIEGVDPYALKNIAIGDGASQSLLQSSE